MSTAKHSSSVPASGTAVATFEPVVIDAEFVEVTEASCRGAVSNRPAWLEAFRDFSVDIVRDQHAGDLGAPKGEMAASVKQMFHAKDKIDGDDAPTPADIQSLAVKTYEVARRAAAATSGERSARYAGFAGEVLKQTMSNEPRPGAFVGFLVQDAKLDAGRGFYGSLDNRLTNEYRLPASSAHFDGQDRLKLRELMSDRSFGIVKGSEVHRKMEALMAPIDIRRKPKHAEHQTARDTGQTPSLTDRRRVDAGLER